MRQGVPLVRWAPDRLGGLMDSKVSECRRHVHRHRAEDRYRGRAGDRERVVPVTSPAVAPAAGTGSGAHRWTTRRPTRRSMVGVTKAKQSMRYLPEVAPALA
jgi:hypothetical protein